MTDSVVAKFGGTSVADFDAMNRSIDVALLDANTRIVVLSASAGVTNILVALAGGLEPTERFFPAGRSASDPVQYSGAFALSQRDPRRD